MARCRLVRPDQVRIYLADVHKHAQRQVEEKLANEKDPEKIKSLTDELVHASEQLRQAELDNDFVDFKRELNTKEARETGRDTKAGAEHTIEQMASFQRARLLQYLLGWSFVDFDGQPLEISAGALDSLQLDAFAELVQAMTLHEERIAGERDERKKIRDGANTSAQTLPSVAI